MTITIRLKDLKKAADICEVGRKPHRIDECAYEFHYKDPKTHESTVMKYGHTMGDKQPLERIYRQAGNIPGWEGGMLKGSAGADMMKIWQAHFPNIHKDDVTVVIHDMYGKTEEDCLDKENQLVEDHKKDFGYPPPGNIKPTKPSSKRGASTDTMFGELFELT
jgi:hypothetical protein